MAEERRRLEAVAVPLESTAPARRERVRRRPSMQSLAVGCSILVAAAGAYLVARETTAFAVRSIDVEGAPAPLAARIRTVLDPIVGRSLVSLDRADAARRVRGLPEIASVSIDRAFPHALRVDVRLERPTAILRQGALAWVVAADARVLAQLTRRPYPVLPRIWIPKRASVVVGATLSGDSANALAVAAVLSATRSPLQVRSVAAGDGELTAVLRSGIQVRLGDTADLRLKLAVAARIAPLARGARYIDVAVPERAVAADQVSS